MRVVQIGDRYYRMLTTREVAKRLSTSPTTVRRWVWNGLLRPVRFPGKRLAFHQAELQRFAKEILGLTL